MVAAKRPACCKPAVGREGVCSNPATYCEPAEGRGECGAAVLGCAVGMVSALSLRSKRSSSSCKCRGFQGRGRERLNMWQEGCKGELNGLCSHPAVVQDIILQLQV